ncbi:MAG: glycosyltransferase [Ruminococcaceae bacterium]|nr:glycosyltransferase [Oscillospiraceae bacterium]
MKKKLLIVAHHLTIGGVQKSLVSALKALDYDKYDVTLYVRKNRTDLLPFVDKRVNVIINKDHHHYYRKPYALILQGKTIIAKILGKKEKAKEINKVLEDKIRLDAMEYEKKIYFGGSRYDIAVAYVQGYVALFVDRCVNADKKILFYHTSTNDTPEIHNDVIPRCSTVAALHESQKSLIEKWYPSATGKIKIVENYTDKDMITAQSKEFSIPESDKTVICSCGRFAPVKGFDMAVDAAKILKEKGVDFIWYFVGDGPERRRLESRIAEYGLSENIVITGMQKNPYPYMAGCDIYVQPSREEALGLTILEAHRLSKPVISTATIGGLKLIENGRNGMICEINPESIAKSIINLINNKEKCDGIISNLKSTDYSHEFEKYKEQWKNLLEG